MQHPFPTHPAQTAPAACRCRLAALVERVLLLLLLAVGGRQGVAGAALLVHLGQDCRLGLAGHGCGGNRELLNAIKGHAQREDHAGYQGGVLGHVGDLHMCVCVCACATDPTTSPGVVGAIKQCPFCFGNKCVGEQQQPSHNK
eukprot:888325-Pelagomonas_calceolata.AAC.2